MPLKNIVRFAVPQHCKNRTLDVSLFYFELGSGVSPMYNYLEVTLPRTHKSVINVIILV